MDKIKNGAKTILVFLGIFMLIIDAGTALSGAVDGVRLCVQTLLPSLFPFIVLSIMAGGLLSGNFILPDRWICKILRIPPGCAALPVLGALGGYPVGAQCVYDAYQNGTIRKEAAQRMLGFCNNAGPAFLFGVIGQMFQSPLIPWILWIIHLLSALLTAWLIPAHSESAVNIKESGQISLPTALERAVKTMGLICGWVILFRVVVAFCDRWFLWLLPSSLQATIVGFLELTNGVVKMAQLPSPGVRFVLSAVCLGFGGTCVALQTASVVKELGTGWYFPGKILQSALSLLLAVPTGYFLFPMDRGSFSPLILIPALILLAVMILWGNQKKSVAIRK